MTRPALSLTITTPLTVLVKRDDILSFRAEDESGGFGIRPGHVDYLTAMQSSVARWSLADRTWHYCALQGVVLTTSNGGEIHIACRTGVIGEDLLVLEEQVRDYRIAESEKASAARVAEARLHARAIRQIMQHLFDQKDMDIESSLGGIFE
jgi:F-type H+-transporting ATPase subunit epsilon